MLSVLLKLVNLFVSIISLLLILWATPWFYSNACKNRESLLSRIFTFLDKFLIGKGTASTVEEQFDLNSLAPHYVFRKSYGQKTPFINSSIIATYKDSTICELLYPELSKPKYYNLFFLALNMTGFLMLLILGYDFSQNYDINSLEALLSVLYLGVNQEGTMVKLFDVLWMYPIISWLVVGVTSWLYYSRIYSIVESFDKRIAVIISSNWIILHGVRIAPQKFPMDQECRFKLFRKKSSIGINLSTSSGTEEIADYRILYEKDLISKEEIEELKIKLNDILDFYQLASSQTK